MTEKSRVRAFSSRALLKKWGVLSSDVFERRTSTGSGHFALLSRDFEQIFGQIVSIRIKTLGNINTVASRLTKREKGSLPVDVRRAKTSLLKLPITVSLKTRRSLNPLLYRCLQFFTLLSFFHIPRLSLYALSKFSLGT